VSVAKDGKVKVHRVVAAIDPADPAQWFALRELA